MDTEILKKKMMGLWKDIFHDSDEYISLVFDNYFNPDLVEYYEEKGQIVSALLAIPYSFGCGGNIIKGLYLCGLATVDAFRHKGIMSKLLERINDKAYGKGYVFTFLIPADNGLTNYYYFRQYTTAMYRIENRYTNVHDFCKEYRSYLYKDDERIRFHKNKYFNSIRIEIIDKYDEVNLQNIKNFIYTLENNVKSYISLIHSLKDIDIVIRENLMSGGNIYVSYNNDEDVTGVAFTNADRKRIYVQRLYHIDQPSYYKILDFINQKNPGFSISIYGYPEEMDSNNNLINHAVPYGMIRILNLHEILEFFAKNRCDSDFSILVRSFEGNLLKCIISYGKVRFEELEPNHKPDNGESVTIFKERELLEILFRKKGSSNLIQEAFGIPRMPINMALLLD